MANQSAEIQRTTANTERADKVVRLIRPQKIAILLFDFRSEPGNATGFGFFEAPPQKGHNFLSFDQVESWFFSISQTSRLPNDPMNTWNSSDCDPIFQMNVHEHNLKSNFSRTEKLIIVEASLHIVVFKTGFRLFFRQFHLSVALFKVSAFHHLCELLNFGSARKKLYF